MLLPVQDLTLGLYLVLHVRACAVWVQPLIVLQYCSKQDTCVLLKSSAVTMQQGASDSTVVLLVNVCCASGNTLVLLLNPQGPRFNWCAPKMPLSSFRMGGCYAMTGQN